MTRPASHSDPTAIARALEDIPMPAYVVGRDRRIRWLNRAALELVGTMVGKPFSKVLAPEALNAALNAFARKMLGEHTTDVPLTLIDSEGRRTSVLANSVPLWENGEIVGVFGLACPTNRGGANPATTPRAADDQALTARQFEILVLLSQGLGTDEIAQQLGIAEVTVRNHTRGLFRQLNVHTRLQAVVRAHRLGLLSLDEMR
jgi:DNA-binding CsgD family transcriptional regulator